MDVKITEKAANNIYFSGLLETVDMQQLLKKTGAGLETIQFGVSDNLDNYKETMQKEKELLKRYGDPAVTVHGPFLDLNPMCYDRMVRDITMLRFNQAYEAAQELEADRIVFHSCMVPTVYYLYGWAERMAEFFNRFMEGKKGIPVCMENVLDRECIPFLEVAEQVESPDFGICLDLGHAWCYSNHTIEEWVDLLKGKIRHVHLHDNDRTADQHRALGNGTVPWEEAVRILQGQRQEITWTIENNTLEDAELSWNRLCRQMEK
ncbi:MAG: sugar phosphate isomerase/epimerase family protein [Eubacteriales bacterium]|nr:sugar phosphate isomerase/epimerase family protein [Eubacteriales bacterium]